MATAEPMMATQVPDLEVGEKTPLVGDDEAPLQDLPESTKKEKAVAGLAAVSFAASLASIIFTANPIVYVSGILGATLSPYAAIQQRKITDVDALSETNERMTEEVDQLKGENDKLEAQVATLSQSVDGLKESKEKLDIIQSVQGKSLNELEKQLVESRSILDSMKDSLVGDILQNLMTVVLAADDNGDMVLSDDEIDELVTNFETLQGIDFDNEMVKKIVIGKGRSVAALMDMVKTLLSSDSLEDAMKQFKDEAGKVDRGISIAMK